MALPTKILVVEDDAVQSSMLTQLLAGQGYAVEGAADGLDALRHLRRSRFDIVLLDYGLPDVNGFAAARLIADLAPAAWRPRMIGLSVTPDMLRGRVAEAAGVFDRVLAKPCAPAELMAAIAAAKARAARPVPGFGARGSLPPIHPTPGPTRGPTSGPSPGPAPQEDAAAAPARVLLVDDDPTVRSIAEAALAAQGFAVETAASGLDAVQMISRTQYQVVVLDIMMPGVDGLAAARLAFELLSGADRPRLVALTSNPDALGAREAGAPSLFDVVVPKAAGMAPLAAAVRQCADYRLRRAAMAPLALGDVARLAALLGRRA